MRFIKGKKVVTRGSVSVVIYLGVANHVETFAESCEQTYKKQ